MAEKENIRQNKSGVSAEQKEKYVGFLKENRDFAFVSFLPVNDTCHFERYNFMCGKDKLNVVYDTKAQILSCTAPADILRRIPFLQGMALDGKDGASQASVQENKKGNTPKERPQPPAVKHESARKKGENKKKEKKSETPQAQPQQKPPAPPVDRPLEKPADKDTKEPKLRPRLLPAATDGQKDKQSNLPQVHAAPQKLPQTHTVRQKLPQQRNAQDNLPQVKQSVNTLPQAAAPDKKQKLPKAKKNKDAAQNAPAVDKKAARGLKKILPDAYDFLSDPSKNDFIIGMVDIGNEKVRLSDYSVLLVPPYRALERFIYDLQCARGISVKMIGQAYEKNAEGVHVLKACYSRKTGVVYSEVMSALYREYFANRNYYAHSDNSDAGSVRSLPDKATAKAIFDNLCKVVNYNAKKLKEIGFTFA